MTHPTSQGHCTLVGAGPGDPELLTLKALKAIQNATVVLVDDLVGPDIAALAPADASGVGSMVSWRTRTPPGFTSHR